MASNDASKPAISPAVSPSAFWQAVHVGDLPLVQQLVAQGMHHSRSRLKRRFHGAHVVESGQSLPGPNFFLFYFVLFVLCGRRPIVSLFLNYNRRISGLD